MSLLQLSIASSALSSRTRIKALMLVGNELEDVLLGFVNSRHAAKLVLIPIHPLESCNYQKATLRYQIGRSHCIHNSSTIDGQLL